MIDYKNPDYLPIIHARAERLNKIRKDKKLLTASKVFYKYNPVQFINDWLFTYDPRRTPSTVPFILWPKQEDYINWLKERYEKKEDGLVEKSRDAGATFLSMAFAVWLYLFWPGSKVGFGSNKEIKIDKLGDIDSIFEKGRMMLRNLPKEFLPAGYVEQKHATFMKFINPENGASITGEAGDNIGRGGRSGIFIKDESAFYEHPESIDAALSQNSDVKIDVSTPNGNGNPFYKKRHGGKLPVFVFDWRDDPRKDQAWYDKQKETLEAWILAQEVDRDYNASVQGICIPAKYVQAAINFKVPVQGAIVAGLDVSDEEGEDSNSLTIREGITVVYREKWNGINTTETARRAYGICNDYFVDMFNYDSIGVGAGIRGEMASLREKIVSEGRYFPVVNAVNVGSTELLGEYELGRLEKDMFANVKAREWWKMRRRFERTYEHVNGIKTWPIDDLISIPNDPDLISQLSQPLRFINEAGKIQIESKKDLKKRGIPSPDDAESLILSFCNPELIPLDRRGKPEKTYGDLLDDYITGKSDVLPWEIEAQKPGGNKYVNFGD